MGDRLTKEREAEIREPRTRRLNYAPQVYEEWDDERADLLAELDAVRAERDKLRSHLVDCSGAVADLDSRLGDALRASGINAADALAMQTLCGRSGSPRIVSALRAIEAWLREGNPFPSMTMGSSWSVSTDEVFEAYEAERAARLTAEARVRELEADQAQAAQAVVDAQACEMAFKERAEKAEAQLRTFQLIDWDEIEAKK